MFLGAPACFISQARPVKIAIKQLFYAIGEPPGLFLSLLPAPQQTIMSCDYNKSLRGIYGDEVGEYNELLPGDSDTAAKDADDDSEDDDIEDDIGEEEMYDDDDDDIEDEEDEYDDDYDEEEEEDDDY